MEKIIPTEKVCNTCKLLLPISSYHKDSKLAGGHVHRCKSCCRIWTQERRKQFTPEKLERERQLCTAWRDLNKDKRQAQSKRDALRHPERIKANNAAFRNRDIEAWRARARKYHYEHQEERAIYSKLYNQRNKEKLQAYRKANRERFRVILHNRRARLRAVGGPKLTKEDIDRKLVLQKGKCYYCKKKMGKDRTIEHVLPIVKGGSNDFSNIVLACQHCNSTKQGRYLHQWPQGGRLL